MPSGRVAALSITSRQCAARLRQRASFSKWPMKLQALVFA
ncbi:hypothetical protein E1H18_2642 [Caulobacter sp. RHG1]|nr:hypothetical protein [Caulobacter sp. RHG1]